jgi:hypothetical protein
MEKMLILKPNTANIIVRLFTIFFSPALLFLIIHYGLKENGNNRIILYFIIAAFVFYLVTVLLTLLAATGVKVETASGEIVFISIIKTEKLTVHDIKNYFETSHRNGFKEWQGLLVILNSGREIHLAGQNLEAISDFKKYLIEKAIPCLGTKRMKYPFN